MSLQWLLRMQKMAEQNVLTLDAVNQFLSKRTTASLPLTQALCDHILAKRGKQIRAQIVLLTAQSATNKADERAIALAAIIELIHNATLLHDDVIDHAQERRFQPAAHCVWDNTSAILAGDYLYGLAFDIMTELEHMPILRHLAKTTQKIVQGEMQQHTQIGDLTTSLEDYMSTIHAKTAELFSTASYTASLLTNHTPEQQEALKQYGHLLGLSFQIKDDMLDYAPGKQTGKTTHLDLKEGKITLPIVLAYQSASATQQKSLETTLKNPTTENIATLRDILRQTSTWEQCKTLLNRTIKQAIDCLNALPHTDAKEALIQQANHNYFRAF